MQADTDVEEINIEESADLITTNRYINRELSWLQFNRRVLEEALNPNHPLMERVRFLSISASNLDEFFMVRVAGLKAQVNKGATSASPDNMTPSEQLEAIDEAVIELNDITRECIRGLTSDLEAVNIFVIKPEQLTMEDRESLLIEFPAKLFPVLSPPCCGPCPSFPFYPQSGPRHNNGSYR